MFNRLSGSNSVRSLALMMVGVCVALSCVPSSRAADAQAPSSHLTVKVPVANMYSKASDDSDVVSQAIYGTDLSVLDQSSGWAHVRTPDDYPGWVRLDTTLAIPSGASGYASAGRIVQVESLTANIYRESDVTAHQPLLTVPFETHLVVEKDGTGDDAGWLEVRLVSGESGWIQNGDVTSNLHALSIEESISLGKRFLGVTYLWGGRSALGFDCSGFTQMLVRSRGINMPRDADLQAAWSGVLPVERKHLRPGDLLFFGSAPDHITHTGMYIGRGKFIHDTTHDHPGVQISRLNDQPWTRLLVAQRRVK